MARVYVIVEGQTEESFVGNVLAPALWLRQVYLIPILLGRTGGRPSYTRVKKDVLVQLKQDQTAYCSTMLDYYGLGPGFPGTPVPPNLAGAVKVMQIENAMKTDIVSQTGGSHRTDLRFLPYLQLHEYEGLLFSDPPRFAAGIGHPHLSTSFQSVRDSFGSPEDINDDPNNAPSKRVLAVHPSYKKPLDGTLGAKAVGVSKMREECPHFRQWVEQLEALEP